MELLRDGVLHTDEPPCCLRINPLEPSVAFFGTYTLIEGQNRKGSIEIWNVYEGQKLNVVATNGAVLDIKLSPEFTNNSLLCTAHSTGNVCVWKVSHNYDLDLVNEFQLYAVPDGSAETLITSINFHDIAPHLLVYTTTTGLVGTLDLNTGAVEELDAQHDLEAWYADFYQIGGKFSNVILSGGDDMNLIGHDMRQKGLIWQSKRIHDAGVVSILTPRKSWCPSEENRVWSGGYDDQLVVMDMRMGQNDDDSFWGMPPTVKEKHNLGGGVWRLIPGKDNRILTCNMYDGGRILGHDDDGLNVEVQRTFKGDHESITYGGDWVDGKAVTCNFYDKVVQTWTV